MGPLRPHLLRSRAAAVACVLALAAGVAVLWAHQERAPAPPAAAPATPACCADSTVPLYEGLGDYRRQVATSSPAGRRYFDQGLALLYGFNHAEAARAFTAALQHDSTFAMAYWGLAMTSSPYVDRGRHPTLDSRAREYLARAAAFAAGATPADRALIAAAAVRFRDSTASAGSLDSAYASALAGLRTRFPDDPDIAALHGESLMLLSRRNYWHPDGSPRPGTGAARASLDAGMRSSPNHAGANHLYIHLFEAAHDAAPAIPAAERLERLAPGAGHLLHMSAHIYFRIGRYDDAVRANRRAWAADREYFRVGNPAPGSVYRSGYHLHTLHFLWLSLAMLGDHASALAVAESLSAKVDTAAANRSPYVQPWTVAPAMAAARFLDAAALSRMRPPPESQHFARAVWHHAAGLIAAERGALAEADGELAAPRRHAAALPAGATVAPTSPAAPLLGIADRMLTARVAELRGDAAAAVALLEEAVALQDGLGHMEPPPWYVPVRQVLGEALLRLGRGADARAVFEADLEQHPRNPRSEDGIRRAAVVSAGASARPR
jgi:tetratricopeptide (TPR) repeat protein